MPPSAVAISVDLISKKLSLLTTPVLGEKMRLLDAGIFSPKPRMPPIPSFVGFSVRQRRLPKRTQGLTLAELARQRKTLRGKSTTV